MLEHLSNFTISMFRPAPGLFYFNQVTLSKIRPIAWRHPSVDAKSSCNVKYKSVSYMDQSSDDESKVNLLRTSPA